MNIAVMTRLDPFRLEPILLDRPWGGTRLSEFGKSLPPDSSIGESWELVDLPQEVVPSIDDPSSLVLDGPFAGARLRDMVADAAEDLMGPVAPTPDGRFPLLFKLLDAREHLSIQVHPNADYATRHPEARLKTESWYVIDSAPGARIYLDTAPGVTVTEVESVMGTPGIVPLLGTQPAEPGAFHHVPAGLIHALGAGVLIAEVQTPSDTTFRIYDWAGEYGRSPRQLHPAESMASITLHPGAAYSLEPDRRPGTRELIRIDDYWMREHRVPTGPADLAISSGPIVVNVTEGSISLGGLELTKGQTAVVPASSGISAFEAVGATVLEMGV